MLSGWRSWDRRSSLTRAVSWRGRTSRRQPGIDGRRSWWDQCRPTSNLRRAPVAKSEVRKDPAEARAAGREILVEQLAGSVHGAVVVQRDGALERLERLDRAVHALQQDRLIEPRGRVGRVDRLGPLELARRGFRAALFVVGLTEIAPQQRVARIQADRDLQLLSAAGEVATPDPREPAASLGKGAAPSSPIARSNASAARPVSRRARRTKPSTVCARPRPGSSRTASSASRSARSTRPSANHSSASRARTSALRGSIRAASSRLSRAPARSNADCRAYDWATRAAADAGSRAAASLASRTASARLFCATATTDCKATAARGRARRSAPAR